MTTVLLRAATDTPQDTITPMALALAEVVQRRIRRPFPLSPLIVDRDLFDRAEKEMMTVMKARGYSEIARAGWPERNFLLHSVAIICEGEG